MSEPAPRSTSLTPLDHVHFIPLDGRLLIHPPAHYGIEPFEMPALPKSLADWIAQLCVQFYHDHHRCLTMLLILDCKIHSWCACIPRQRAAPDGASWQPAKEDFCGASPHSLVAGSFQTRVFAPGDDPQDSAPTNDGIHLILSLNAEKTIHCFISCDGRATMVLAAQIIDDDMATMIDGSMDRITLV